MVNNSTFAKILFTFALVLGFNSAFAAWDGTTKEKPDEKSGFCIIDSEEKLAWYAVVTKGDNSNNYSKCNAKLTADLDMGGKLWTPIAAGTGDPKFEKIFDGNGHKIKNLYINGTELYKVDKKYAQNLGFVAVLGKGTIKNLVLENVDIQASTSTGEVMQNTDNDHHQISVGAFVGWMSDDKSLVESCMSSGIISTTGSGQGVGGIVGNAMNGQISNCLSLVEIRTSGSDAYVGGIIGLIKKNVSVKSCVYAGPGLVNIGSNGSVGGITGNVFSGNLKIEEDYYEGDENLQGVGATCLGNTKPDGSCNSSISVTGKPVEVDISNQDSVACHLNGINEDKTCKTEPWSVGETALSLFGYGEDGYKIVFYANGGKFADNSESRNKFFDAGMAIYADDIVPPSHENKTFIGWALTRNATEAAENLGIVSKSDTVFAVWQDKLTVTFIVSPGVFPDENVYMKTKRVDKGGLVTVGGLGTLPTSYSERSPDSVSYGSETLFYFTGWARNSNATESDTIHLDDFTTDVDLTLYAVWTTEETYTVTYNANGHGKTRVDYVRVKNNNKIERPQDPIAHDGYEFVDWFTEASCENSFNFANSPITESITLYAKWEPQNYTITYVIGDGVANATENPSEYNIETETINLKAPTPAEGMVFDGWFNDAAFSKKVTRIAKGSFGDKTFYAKWSTKTYRISYLADNNSYGSVSDQIKEHGSSITLLSSANFTRNKDTDTYEVIGWAETPNGEKKYELGQTYETDASLILYPAWSHKRYTITYKCDDCVNNSANPNTYTIDDAVVLANPEKDSYTFEGWFGNVEFNGDAITGIAKGSTGDTTFYAKWKPIEYTITYDTDNGTLPDGMNNSQIYSVESDDIMLPTPIKDGYKFEGWLDSKTNTSITILPQGSVGDRTLTAQWSFIPIVSHYGAVTITEYEAGKKKAEMEGRYGEHDGEADTVDIPKDIVVESVTLNREFSVNVPSTFTLPFDIDVEKIQGAKFYEFGGAFIKNGVRKFQANRVKSGILPANTPYMIIPTATKIEFEGPVVFRKTVDPVVKVDRYEFHGVYAYKTVSEEENGAVYGLLGKDCNGISQGRYVKFMAPSYFFALRAYIVDTEFFKPKASFVKSPIGNQLYLGTVDIEVDWNEGDDIHIGEKTTGIHKVKSDPKTIRMERTYDLKGRLVKGTPKAKGVYINKKVNEK